MKRLRCKVTTLAGVSEAGPMRMSYYICTNLVPSAADGGGDEWGLVFRPRSLSLFGHSSFLPKRGCSRYNTCGWSGHERGRKKVFPWTTRVAAGKNGLGIGISHGVAASDGFFQQFPLLKPKPSTFHPQMNSSSLN